MSDPIHNPAQFDDLLSRARGGDAEAYGLLFGACCERVLTYIQLRMSPQLAAKVEAHDILQESGLAGFRGIAGFEPKGRGAFSRWLCAIAENRMKDTSHYHRAVKRQARGEQEAISLVLDRVRMSVTGPGSAAAREEEHGRLRERLESLPQDERRALMLRYYCGATTTAIAHELGTSETSARRLLARGIDRLGDLLEGGQ